MICWIAHHLTKSPSLFYRLDKDLGEVKIPVVVFDSSGKEMKIYPEKKWQELSLEEIGEATGVGRETVKSRLRYAMDRLRTRLNE